MKVEKEKALVVGIHTPKSDKFESDESLKEAIGLATTAGADVVYSERVDLRQFNPATLIGSGKLESLLTIVKEQCVDLVVVDHELSPVQSRNLETFFKIRVLDRTGLILDIFALRARSKEGKLQVELAQYEYLLPRLVGAWTHLSKQRGGIGLRGPGETQLEVDRRRVRERISLIKKNLEKVTQTRENHRTKRQSVPIPTLSLIGYTNAGKSTLFNAITGAHELAEDKVFATLDPKTKKIKLPTGQKVLLTDTVGFIRNLPHQLVESFKSTFEEVANSQVLLHVIDLSHPDCDRMVKTVEDLLVEMDLHQKPLIKVYNKVDALENPPPYGSHGNHPQEVWISAESGLGIDDLLKKVQKLIAENYYKRLSLLIPHEHSKEISSLYEHGVIISLKSADEGVFVTVDLPEKWQRLYDKFSNINSL